MFNRLRNTLPKGLDNESKECVKGHQVPKTSKIEYRELLPTRSEEMDPFYWLKKVADYHSLDDESDDVYIYEDHGQMAFQAATILMNLFSLSRVSENTLKSILSNYSSEINRLNSAESSGEDARVKVSEFINEVLLEVSADCTERLLNIYQIRTDMDLIENYDDIIELYYRLLSGQYSHYDLLDYASTLIVGGSKIKPPEWIYSADVSRITGEAAVDLMNLSCTRRTRQIIFDVLAVERELDMLDGIREIVVLIHLANEKKRSDAKLIDLAMVISKIIREESAWLDRIVQSSDSQIQEALLALGLVKLTKEDRLKLFEILNIRNELDLVRNTDVLLNIAVEMESTGESAIKVAENLK